MTLPVGATFAAAARSYRDRGWLGTLPLPTNRKYPPPTGFTGRNAPYADDEQVAAWSQEPGLRQANLGLHLGAVVLADGAEALEVIGIDVDDYGAKSGGAQLKQLEGDLGDLPPTAVSSARGDGVSGIRFFLVPAGLAWRSKLDAGIDVIQKCHRYAVVWPSVHPDGGVYRWYLGGASPDGQNAADEIPAVSGLPRLPDAWVDFGTNGQTRDDGRPADLESTPDELAAWAEGEFYDYSGQPCRTMRRAVRRWKQRIVDEESSHDKITGAHWELICLADKGHTGLHTAKARIDRAVTRDTVARRGKRSLSELRGELFRSYVNGLRKAKADHDTHPGYGAARCFCEDEEIRLLHEIALAPGGGWAADARPRFPTVHRGPWGPRQPARPRRPLRRTGGMRNVG